MNLSSEPILEPAPQPTSKPRRKRSFLPSLSSNERSEIIQNLARRVEPSFDFFLFSLLSGAVLAAGWLFHAPAILIVGVLLAPFMAPVIGLSLAAAIGSFRFLIVSFAGLLVCIFLVFITGLIAGLASPLFPQTPLDSAYRIGYLPWDILATYLIGIGLTCLSLIKSEQTPVLPSAILSYALLTRASVAGYELGQGNLNSALWQIEVLGILLLAGIVIGMLFFWGFAFRPEQTPAYTMAVIFTIALAWVSWKVTYPAVTLLKDLNIPMSVSSPGISTKTGTASLLPTATRRPSRSVTPSPFPKDSVTPTRIHPSQTPSASMTPEGPYILAFVAADGQDGARLRERPSFGGKVIKILDNQLMVKILPGVEFNEKVYWAHVQTIDGTIGWMVHSVLITATPIPTNIDSPTP